MKKQRAIHTYPNESLSFLNEYLSDGWTVVSTTAYRPSNDRAFGTILVIIEKNDSN